jgi:multisubunit Na+/H+ antiporter MnhC subunit
MSKAIRKLLLFNIPFFLVSGFMFYSGFTADEKALTDDGYNLKWFFFLMGTAFLVIPLAISFGIAIWMVAKRKRMEELIATGKQGTAVVLELSDTGTRINDNPRVRLLLEIHIPNYQPYQAQKTVTLPLIYLPQVQTGSTINILADPAQPNNEKRIALLLK